MNNVSRHFDPFRQPASGWILHCDADAFYASCHMAQRPELREQPVVVAGDVKTRHGIIVTANYRARQFGIETGMNLGQAWQLCPDIVAITPDKSLYRRYSEHLHHIFQQYTGIIEPLALDEAWLDMSNQISFAENPAPVAASLQAQVRERLGITISIGISVNKMLAKQVSDWNKPEGITVLRKDELPERLWPRPVTELFGCGPVTAQKMARLGIQTIGDLAQQPLSAILHQFGQHGLALYLRAKGDDYTPVINPRFTDRRSVSAEHTTAQDLSGIADILALFQQCSQEISARLLQLGLVGYRMGIKWRTTDFRLHSKQLSSSLPLQSTDSIYRLARQLWFHVAENRPVRLIGITVSLLELPSPQLRFWDE